jgi:D-amino-acid dehydrogenase
MPGARAARWPQHYADLVRPVGQVHVWETDAENDSAALERRLRERQGIPSHA